MKSRLVMLLASTLVVASLISPVLGRSLSARADCYDCWTAIPSPNPGEGTDNHLHAVGAISDTDAWAVGNIGAFYTKFPIAMHWDGTDWNLNSPATWGQSDNELYGVAMMGSDNVLAVGDYTDESSSVVQTLTFLWDGEAWQHISSPNVGSGDNYLYAVAPNMPLKAWAVGTAGGQTLTMKWLSGVWGIVPSPNAPNSTTNVLNGVAVISDNDIWAVGFSVEASTGRWRTLTEHWNGSQWSIIASPNHDQTGNSVLRAVSASDSGYVWAVGYYTDNGITHTLIERYENGQWFIVSSPNANGNTNYLFGVTASSSRGNAWAAGYYETKTGSNTLVEAWNGTSWEMESTPNPESPDNHLLAIYAPPSINPWGGHVWAVGETGDIFLPDTLTLRKTVPSLLGRP